MFHVKLDQKRSNDVQTSCIEAAYTNQKYHSFTVESKLTHFSGAISFT